MLSIADLRRPLPPNWNVLVGGDTGTYMSSTIVGFPPDSFDAYVLYEQPNYRYVGGEPELLDISIPEWSKRLLQEYRRFVPGASRLTMWLDENSQFKTELRRYHINARGNRRKLELRVEISREYFQNRRVFLAPWLTVLPYELEHATWPDDTASSGRFERLKVNDHTLDCLEHVLSRRPKHITQTAKKKESLLDRLRREHRRVDMGPRIDPHLGAQ